MTIARPYQDTALNVVDDNHARDKDCIVVLPTGAGKTLVGALHILRVRIGNPTATFLFLQHTEELIEQNMATVAAVTGLHCTIVKGPIDDWSGDVVFASVPTLTREARLASMKACTNLIVDECHHSAATGWERVIRRAREVSPSQRALSLSATPDRADGLPLPPELGDIVYRVYVQELIDLGHLVQPRAFSVSLGDTKQRIALLGNKAKGEGDQSEVAKILDTPKYNKAVVEQWLARAKGRPTVAFCSTVEHAKHVAEAFCAAGVRAAAVDYRDQEERRRVIAAYKDGELDVITNCLLLTEGFDYQPTSCVIVLRAMIHVSTFMQALGRALRVVDAERYPGVIKWDAICLDYSGAAERHQQLDESTVLPTAIIDIDDFESHAVEPREHEADNDDDDDDDFAPELREIDLANAQFRWTDIHGDGRTLLASGLRGYATIFKAGGQWMAVGQEKDKEAHIVHHGAQYHAFAAACDWIRLVETDDRAVGNRRWLDNKPSDGQKKVLRNMGLRDTNIETMTRYEASCQITYSMAKKDVLQVARQHLEKATKKAA